MTRLARALLSAIPVFYRPEMVSATQFFAPGTFKPAACVEDWTSRGLPIEICDFKPASEEQLCLAHDRAYVKGVLEGRVRNGFGGTQDDVAATLPFTTGAMVAAAERAISNGAVACAPVSGFHHARYAASAGYCTFNGLVVTSLHLQQQGLARRVGILDLDQHFGDGTEEILQRLTVKDVQHESWGVETLDPSHADRWLDNLSAKVAGFAECDVLLYQAGADPHVDDPLGGWMTAAQLRQRDLSVFSIARAIGLPVAWNLAGGYLRDTAGGIGPILSIHRQTITACVQTFLD